VVVEKPPWVDPAAAPPHGYRRCGYCRGEGLVEIERCIHWGPSGQCRRLARWVTNPGYYADASELLLELAAYCGWHGNRLQREGFEQKAADQQARLAQAERDFQAQRSREQS
jgi:hypothetical protein